MNPFDFYQQAIKQAGLGPVKAIASHVLAGGATGAAAGMATGDENESLGSRALHGGLAGAAVGALTGVASHAASAGAHVRPDPAYVKNTAPGLAGHLGAAGHNVGAHIDSHIARAKALPGKFMAPGTGDVHHHALVGAGGGALAGSLGSSNKEAGLRDYLPRVTVNRFTVGGAAAGAALGALGKKRTDNEGHVIERTPKGMAVDVGMGALAGTMMGHQLRDLRQIMPARPTERALVAKIKMQGPTPPLQEMMDGKGPEVRHFIAKHFDAHPSDVAGLERAVDKATPGGSPAMGLNAHLKEGPATPNPEFHNPTLNHADFLQQMKLRGINHLIKENSLGSHVAGSLGGAAVGAMAGYRNDGMAGAAKGALIGGTVSAATGAATHIVAGKARGAMRAIPCADRDAFYASPAGRAAVAIGKNPRPAAAAMSSLEAAKGGFVAHEFTKPTEKQSNRLATVMTRATALGGVSGAALGGLNAELSDENVLGGALRGAAFGGVVSAANVPLLMAANKTRYGVLNAAARLKKR